MKPRRRRSPPSSTGSAPVELELPTAPWFVLLLTLHAVGLPLSLLLLPLRHGAAAAAICAALALWAAPAVARAGLGRGPRAPRRLCFSPEGEFRLDLAGGYSEPVTPADRTLAAGPWWVLVLDGRHRRHQVVLETFRVDPATLAALARALRRAAAGRPGDRPPALRSLIEPGRRGG